MVHKRRKGTSRRVSPAPVLDSIGRRLNDAIDRRFGSERRFQERLQKKAPGLKRTSRNVVRKFVRDEATPPDGWIDQAAAVLEVRSQWLKTGEGARTEAEEALRRARPLKSEAEFTADLLAAAVPLWRDLGEAARASVLGCWAELATGADIAEVVKREGQMELLRGDEIALQLAKAVELPLDALRLSTGPFPLIEFETYTELLMLGIRTFARARRAHMEEIRRELNEG